MREIQTSLGLYIFEFIDVLETPTEKAIVEKYGGHFRGYICNMYRKDGEKKFIKATSMRTDEPAFSLRRDRLEYSLMVRAIKDTSYKKTCTWDERKQLYATLFKKND